MYVLFKCAREVGCLRVATSLDYWLTYVLDYRHCICENILQGIRESLFKGVKITLTAMQSRSFFWTGKLLLHGGGYGFDAHFATGSVGIFSCK